MGKSTRTFKKTVFIAVGFAVIPSFIIVFIPMFFKENYGTTASAIVLFLIATAWMIGVYYLEKQRREW